ncbi:TPA: hypothetical protein ACNV5P_005217, partial [Enterobacter asburiae]|nr:hypothetical protein [Enterobacter asburiae]HEG2045278.1 hypothetical protein [Enterobacter asburiae]
SVRYITNFPEFSKDIDVKAMQVYSLISSIDIAVEALQQLHRIIENDHKLVRWPFNEFNHVFSNKIAHLSNKKDDEYFKEVRSIFGAHPTNLCNNGERMFASWPHFHAFNGNDFTVSIYNNIPGKDDVIFGIKINELLIFLKERYEYLVGLKDAVVAIRDKHYENLIVKIIPKSGNIHEELKILLSEVVSRGDNDYYKMEVQELIYLFEADIKEAHLLVEANEFQGKLLPVVEEIRCNLQNMTLVDLTTTEGVIFSSLPNYALSYELQKLFTWLHSDRYDPMGNYYIEQLNKFSKGRYCFSITDNESTTLLKLRMMLHSHQ